ncbi:DUF4347 domain-containing protein, partial [Thalassospira sp.]
MPTSATRAGIKTQSVLHVQGFADVLPLALEPRYMFDAAGAVTAAESAEQAQADSEAENATSGSADDTTSADGGDQESAALAAALAQASSTGFHEIQSADPSQNNGRKEAVLIDTSVADWQILANGVAPGKAIILLDGARDGISLMAQWAEGNSGYDAIHLLSHGSEGQLHVGTATLTQESLTGRADELQMLGNALAEDGDLLLYGCDVAGGEGAAFVNALATLTGADVAASTDMTGTASLGGDWDLEAHFGTIDVDDAGDFTAYSGILETVSFDSSDEGITNLTKTVGGQTLTFSSQYGFYDLGGPGAGYSQAFNDDSVGNGSDGTKFTMAIATGYSFDLTGFKYFTEQDDTITITVTYADDSTATGTLAATKDSAQTITDFSVFSGISTTSLNDIKSVVISSVNGGSNSGLGVNDIEVVDVKAIVSNTAPELGGTPADVTVTEDTPTAIDLSAYNVSDGDGDTITLTLAVDRGTIAGAAGTGITITNSGSGSMTLQGSAANLNTYLNDTTKITYTPASNDTTAATLTVTPNDGTTNGTADTVTINITAVNDAPTATNLTQTVPFTEDGGSVALGDIVVTDVDSGETVTATLTVGNIAAGTLTTGTFGSATSSYTAGTGVWTVTGSVTDVNAALAAVAFTPAANWDQDVTITTRIRDAANTGPADGTITLDATAVNDAPVATASGGATAFTEGAGAVAIDGSFTLSDVDSANMSGATIAITGNFQNGSDVLAFTNQNGISGSYNASTGVLTLSGSASAANYQAAIRSITFGNSSDDPSTSNRTISITVNDGTDDSNTATKTVSVAAVNDAPTATATGGSPTFTEGGTAVDLFSGVAISTVESGQTISGMTFTVTNAEASDSITFDGTAISLVNGTGSTATNGLTYNVSVTGGVATITITGGTLSTADAQTVVDGMT